MASFFRSPAVVANAASALKRVCSTNIWKGHFDSQLYLKTRYPPPGSVRNHFAEFLLNCIHRFQARLPSSGIVRVLEYGCGPVPIHTASFAGKDSEIVLAEYLESNRREVEKWLTRDESSFNWTPYIEYVVRTLEMQEEDAVSEREEKMRVAVKAVIPCDIHSDQPLQLETKSRFDVVLSAFCIEAGTSTREEYLDAVRKLSCLVRPGGSLLLFSGNWPEAATDHCGYYTVGENTFYNVAVNSQLVARALEGCGGKELAMDELDVDPEAYGNIRSDMKGFIFASATID